MVTVSVRSRFGTSDKAVRDVRSSVRRGITLRLQVSTFVGDEDHDRVNLTAPGVNETPPFVEDLGRRDHGSTVVWAGTATSVRYEPSKSLRLIVF